MRVIFVSTYPPIECGIATYTHWLTEALRTEGVDISVISHIGAAGDGVIAVYEPERLTSVDDVAATCAQLQPDIVHVQHEYGVFGPGRGVAVLDLLVRFQRVRIPTITTLHTVHEMLDPEQEAIMRRLVYLSSRVIVHEDFQREYIAQKLGRAISEKIDVIEHGVRITELVPRAKRKLGLQGTKVVLLCGYIRPRKAFHKIVELFPGVVEKIPEAVLVLASKLRRPNEFVSYRESLLDLVSRSPCADRIRVLQGEFPQEEFDTILSAADVVVLPYEKGAQSGVLANCFAFHRPVVTSDLAAFKAIIGCSGAGIIARSGDGYVAGITSLLGSPKLRRCCEANMTRYVRGRASWHNIALKHRQVYLRALASGEEGQRSG